MSDFASLPPDLPVPEDDGAADHLPGAELPSVSLPVAGGGRFDFRGAEAAGTLVAFVYPRTARSATATMRSPAWARPWWASARWTRPSRPRSPSARRSPTRS
jgi:hypothetical protein